MKQWIVSAAQTTSWYVTVEAEKAAEAIERAQELDQLDWDPLDEDEFGIFDVEEKKDEQKSQDKVPTEESS